MAADILVKDEGAFSFVEGNTDEGEQFVDAWLFGVLEVQDAGRVTVATEVVPELVRAASQNGLEVEES